MRRRQIILSLLLFIAAAVYFVYADSASAKDGKAHIRDWEEVFNMAALDNNGRKNLDELWNFSQKIIDDPDYNALKSRFEWLSFNAGEHRFFFHWGFNTNPERFRPLQKFIAKRLDAYVSKANMPPKEAEIFKKSQYKEFFNYITKKIQPDRNRRLINTIIKTTGIPRTRGYAGAVATIIHDIHLLGDYSTHATDALPDINDIQRDLLDNGFARLLAGSGADVTLSDIRSAFRAAQNNINSRRAELLIQETGRFLPEILNNNFGSDVLKRKGIFVKISDNN
ncbi:MAG: hypothetical protein IJ520_01975 [Synergistaceae bacterium]|nr:hypothetical protein [Synergistaceae bacterium]